MNHDIHKMEKTAQICLRVRIRLIFSEFQHQNHL